MKDPDQPLDHLHAVSGDLLADLIARAPQHDGRVVPVAADEAGYVPLRPFVEVVAVSVGSLVLLPLVEDLIHHQEAQFVAQVHEFRRVGIVRGPNGVAAHRLQDLQPPFPNPLRHRLSHRTAVVMQADAVQFHLLAVQQESLVHVELSPPNPKNRVVLVDHPVLFPHRGAHPVKIGIVRRPQVRLVHSSSAARTRILRSLRCSWLASARSRPRSHPGPCMRAGQPALGSRSWPSF